MAESSGGLGPLGTLKNIAATLLSTAQTRLALLANEIQTQKLHALRQLAWSLALVFCLGLGVLLAVALAVTVWWEQRVLILGLFTLVFLGLAAYFFLALKRSLSEADPVFAATLAELQEDLRQLRAVTGHEQKPR